MYLPKNAPVNLSRENKSLNLTGEGQLRSSPGPSAKWHSWASRDAAWKTRTLLKRSLSSRHEGINTSVWHWSSTFCMGFGSELGGSHTKKHLKHLTWAGRRTASTGERGMQGEMLNLVWLFFHFFKHLFFVMYLYIYYLCVMCVEAQVWCGCLPQLFLTLCFETVSHWTWSSQFQLDWLASELQGSSYLCFSKCWVRGICQCALFFTGCWGSKLRPICLCGKHSTEWTISPVPGFSLSRISFFLLYFDTGGDGSYNIPTLHIHSLPCLGRENTLCHG